MTAVYPPKVDFGKTTIRGLRFAPLKAKSSSAKELALPYEDIGARLRTIRTHLSDLNQREWAERHDFNKTQYNNWEKGTRRIPVDAALKLCSLYGLTLDAIYRGRLDGLPENLAKVL